MAEHVETHAARTARLIQSVRGYLAKAQELLSDPRRIGGVESEVSAALRAIQTLRILEGGRKSQTAPEATEGQPGPYSTT